MKYVTFNESGELTGAYIQDLHPDHSDSYIEVNDADYSQWVMLQANADRTGVEIAPPPAIIPPTAEQIIVAVTVATQLRLDTFAQTRNYDGILSACTYATSSVPKFAAEGQYCVDARDATWATLYTIMGEVIAQTRPMPESFAAVAPLLPVLEWPA